MGNLYNWHDERMNELKLKEIHQEIEHQSLLKEAGLSEPGIFSRLLRALGNWLQPGIRREKRDFASLNSNTTVNNKSKH